MNLYITKSKHKNKKYVLLDSNKKYLLSFGASMYSDYTIHKDERYISRYKNTEDWAANGIQTAYFMSRFLLWNLPTLQDSIRDTNRRFNINIKLI